MAENPAPLCAYVRRVLVGSGRAEGGMLRPGVPDSLVGAGDLQTCLARLSQRNVEARTQTSRALQQHSAELGSVLAHGYEHAQAVESMERQLRGLALGVAEEPRVLGLPDAEGSGACVSELHGLRWEWEIDSKARAARGAAAAAREQQQLVSALQCVAGIQQALRQAEVREAAGDLEGAARTVAKLRERLMQADGQLGEGHAAGQKLLHSLFALVTERASQLVDSLDAVLRRLCIADGAARSLVLFSDLAQAPGSATEPVAAGNLRTTMHSLEVLLGGQGPAWSRMAEVVLSSLLSPFLKQPTQEVVVEESSADEGPCSTSGSQMLLLRLAPPQAAGLSAEQVIMQHLYPKLGLLLDSLKAFFDTACSPGAFSAVWKLMWPRVAESIISLHLCKVVPVDLKQLESVGLVQQCTEQFESALRAKGILEPLEGQDEAGARPAEGEGNERERKGDLLMQFVADVDVHFAAKKRVLVLAQVRRVLLSSGDFTSSLVTLEPDMRILKHKGLVVPGLDAAAEDSVSSSRGEAFGPHDTSVLQWEPCHVTHAAQDVLSIVQETLLEACASTERTAPEMYRAAREAVVLFKALSASHGRGKAWEDVPHLAILAHNDFLFMGHCLLTLAYQLRHRLPAGVRPSALFVDMVPFLWEQAATVSAGILLKQQRQLMEALDGAHRFAHADQEEGYSLAMKALKMVLYQLSQVTSVLLPVMAPSAFAKFLLSLIDSVLERCCTDILSHQDISVDETEHLRKVFLGLLERIPTVLEEPRGTSPSAEALARSKEHKEACRQMLSFRKLQRLTDILDMSLVAITQAWRTGDLAASGFTGEEVHHLIRAIFSDTPLRRECLAQIGPS